MGESVDENGDHLASAELESAELETAQLEARAMARRIREIVGDTDQPALNVYDKALKQCVLLVTAILSSCCALP